MNTNISNEIKQIKVFSPKQVFKLINDSEERVSVKVRNRIFEVKMNSDRYRVFQQNPSCVACGITGSKFILECSSDYTIAYFNFYAEEDGKDVLMTKDHILAKAYGGKDHITNYATCCSICNALKASYPISYESVLKLRNILRNEISLSNTKLKRLIIATRLSMLDYLNGQ